jgi:A/G-specific adenine glycosylase
MEQPWWDFFVMPSDSGQRLLDWYDRARRDLPWRAKPGETPDPYRVWLSEIMLQQTTVVTVIPYFEAFTARWPTVRDLAAAEPDQVMHAWQGLGYYARARNLLSCARVVTDTLDGRFPGHEDGLRALPGIGAYTAAAMAAIAFSRPSVPVDGNIARVMTRLFAVDDPLPGVRDKAGDLARPLLDPTRPGDFAQALMDLGATVCTPRKPSCELCPWEETCRAHAMGTPEAFPVKAPRKAKPTRHGVVFWIKNGGRVYLRRRPDKGLLGGMMEFPSTDWRETPWSIADATSQAPVEIPWCSVPGSVRHTFTHFHLELTVLAGETSATLDGRWCAIGDLAGQALPTVMKKVARLAEPPPYSS